MVTKLTDGRLRTPDLRTCDASELTAWLKAMARVLEPLGTPELRCVAPRLVCLPDWEWGALDLRRPLESAAWRELMVTICIGGRSGSTPSGRVIRAIVDGRIRVKVRRGMRFVDALEPSGKCQYRLPVSGIVMACLQAEETLVNWRLQQENPENVWPTDPKSIGPALKALRSALIGAEGSLGKLHSYHLGLSGPFVLTWEKARSWLNVVLDMSLVGWWVNRIRKRLKDVPVLESEAQMPSHLRWQAQMGLLLDDLASMVRPSMPAGPVVGKRDPIVAGHYMEGNPAGLITRLEEQSKRLRALRMAYEVQPSRRSDLKGVGKPARWFGKHTGGNVTGKELANARRRKVVLVSAKGRGPLLYCVASVCEDSKLNDYAKQIMAAIQRETR